MNKWLSLLGTLFISVAFSTTVRTTLANPSISNLLISGVLLVLIIVGLWLFYKSDDKKQQYQDEFTPTD